MELLEQILVRALEKEQIAVTFTNASWNAGKVGEMLALQALSEIRDVLNDDDLSDFDCVEKIVVILEAFGSNGGARHDFG